MNFAPEMTIGGHLTPGDLVRVFVGNNPKYGIAVIADDDPADLQIATFINDTVPTISFRAPKDVGHILNLGQDFRVSLDDLSVPRRQPQHRAPYIVAFGERAGIFIGSREGFRMMQVQLIDFADWTVKTVDLQGGENPEYFGWSAWIDEAAGGLGRAAPLLTIALE